MMRDDEAPALDPSVIETLRLLNEPGQPDVVHEVLGLFLSDATTRVEAIIAAFDARDAATLQRAAHTMKGAAATIGALRLQHACRRVEDAAKQNDLTAAATAIADVQREHQEVANAIRALIRPGA